MHEKLGGSITTGSVSKGGQANGSVVNVDANYEVMVPSVLVYSSLGLHNSTSDISIKLTPGLVSFGLYVGLKVIQLDILFFERCETTEPMLDREVANGVHQLHMSWH